FDHETQAFGLAVTGGLVSSTGIAGFTLGGGIGWLLREYGLTCDSLLSADVVTADGQLVTASEHEHPDLFWALRGGGGNFGVVTSMEFRLHPVGPLVFAGPVFYAGAAAAAVLRGWRDLTVTMPDQLTSLATSSSRRRCRSCPRRFTASWWSGSSVSTRVTSRTVPRPPSRSAPWASPWPTSWAPCPTRPSRACSTRCGPPEPRTISPAHSSAA